MKQSIFFYKELTPAEVGKTGTHEIYIRLPNNFDYESFFGESAVMNGSVIEVNFIAQDITNGGKESVSLRFVYFKNSNHEKRIPSLGPLFKSHNVQEGDIVSLERRTEGTNISYYLCFYKKEEMQIAPAAIYFSQVEQDSVNEKNTQPLQQIFYGAPGTGKSHRIKEYLKGKNVPAENIFRTTFHPDSDYSTFVGAYKPTMKKQYRYDGRVKAKYYEDDDLAGAKQDDVIVDKVIHYDFVPQTFVKAYVRAYQTDENVYLVIEEINRGNCAQIFGDLFQLLDRDENGVSDYTVKADDDLRVYLEDVLGKDNKGIKDGELCLPANLYIFATMNTSDQSLFPIDSAFKRRWDWEYEPIKYKNTDWVIEIGGNEYSWVSFQKEVNNRIFEATNSEDKMLGDFFVKPHNGIISEKLLLNKVLFYLWNDVCKDGDGDIFKTDENKDVKFSDLYGENGTKVLLSMMDHLGVNPVSESDEEDDDDGEDSFDNNGGKDRTKYSINGEGRYAKKYLSTELVRMFIRQNPEMSATEVVNKWKSLGKFVSHFIETQAEYDVRADKKDRMEPIPCNGETIYLSTNGWGGQDVMDNLISAIPQEWNLNVEKLPQ